MSIVAVHGPNTWGSKAIVEAGPVQAVVNPANGLIWTFKLDGASTRADADFSWAFPTDGTPTPQTVKAPTPVTYASAGNKTATLTVTGAGTGANPYPPAGSYPVTVSAKAGTAAQAGLLSAPGGDGDEGSPLQENTQALRENTEALHENTEEVADDDVFDPAEYTIQQVEDYVNANPDQTEDVLIAEEEGKNRVTLVAWLEARLDAE